MGLLDRVEAFFEGEPNVEKHSHSHAGYQCDDLHAEHAANRFQSFAAPSSGNIKWFVDGASYFWAVSEALQREFCQLSAKFIDVDISFHRRPGEYLYSRLVAEPRAVSSPPPFSQRAVSP